MQPKPKNNELPAVWGLVLSDMSKRDIQGKKIGFPDLGVDTASSLPYI